MPTLDEIRQADPSTTLNVNRIDFTVGALLRRQVRIELDVNDYEYTEYKGFLESTFVVRGRMTCAKYLALVDWLPQFD